MRPPKKRAIKLGEWSLIRHRQGDPRLVGYARVSTREQSLDVQVERLKAAGCCNIFAEKTSGASTTRPGWEALLEHLRPKDTLVVLRVDRIGRRLAEMVRALDKIRDMGAHVRSLEESIDTAQRGGRFAFAIVATLAEKVRDDIRENTRAALEERKRRGIKLGRPSSLEPAKLAQLTHLRAQGFSLREIGRAANLSHTTVKRGLHLAAHLRGDPRQMQLTGTEAAQ